jgi:hypothetical protein
MELDSLAFICNVSLPSSSAKETLGEKTLSAGIDKVAVSSTEEPLGSLAGDQIEPKSAGRKRLRMAKKKQWKRG